MKGLKSLVGAVSLVLSSSLSVAAQTNTVRGAEAERLIATGTILATHSRNTGTPAFLLLVENDRRVYLCVVGGQQVDGNFASVWVCNRSND
jgi:hypothetical protein